MQSELIRDWEFSGPESLASIQRGTSVKNAVSTEESVLQSMIWNIIFKSEREIERRRKREKQCEAVEKDE